MSNGLCSKLAQLGLTLVEVRVFKVAQADYAPELLRLRDLIDIAEATGLDPTEFGATLAGNSGSPADRIKALAGFAWIINRRDEPNLTYDDVLDGRVISEDAAAEDVSDSQIPLEFAEEPAVAI